MNPQRATGRRLLRAGLLPLLALGLPNGAAADPLGEFMRCLEIEADQARLACYDRLAQTVVELGPAAILPPTGASDPATAAAPGPAQAEAQAPPATPEDAFGNERNTLADSIESITANIVGGFSGWDGDTIFELDNGQVWQQSAAGRFNYAGTNRAVTIRRGAFGSFLLSPDGLNRSVRVQRIK